MQAMDNPMLVKAKTILTCSMALLQVIHVSKHHTVTNQKLNFRDLVKNMTEVGIFRYH